MTGILVQKPLSHKSRSKMNLPVPFYISQLVLLNWSPALKNPPRHGVSTLVKLCEVFSTLQSIFVCKLRITFLFLPQSHF